jgi:hypothetical protein
VNGMKISKNYFSTKYDEAGSEIDKGGDDV